jgi:hypothetical protein
MSLTKAPIKPGRTDRHNICLLKEWQSGVPCDDVMPPSTPSAAYHTGWTSRAKS